MDSKRIFRALSFLLTALVLWTLFPVCGQQAAALVNGDVSGDGILSAADARLCLRCAVGLESFAKGSAEYNACDSNGDGTVTAADARLLLRAAVGLPNEDEPAFSDGYDTPEAAIRAYIDLLNGKNRDRIPDVMEPGMMHLLKDHKETTADLRQTTAALWASAFEELDERFGGAINGFTVTATEPVPQETADEMWERALQEAQPVFAANPEIEAARRTFLQNASHFTVYRVSLTVNGHANDAALQLYLLRYNGKWNIFGGSIYLVP